MFSSVDVSGDAFVSFNGNPSSDVLELGELIAGSNLPLLVTPASTGVNIIDIISSIRPIADLHLPVAGALLFRGFGVKSPEVFQHFARALGGSLLSYEFGSTPRSKVGQGIYTSTEYPSHQHIPLHNEQSYTRTWPMKIWFHCALPSEEGGETPIADSRAIYKMIDPDIRKRFISKGLMYVRNSGNGMDVPWAQVFNTDQRPQVEAYCRKNGIAWEWKEDGELRTRQVCQAVAEHPHTKEMVWFNQAHLFHISSLEPHIRETLLDVADEEDLPRNVYYGNGTCIEDSVLDEIRGVMDVAKVSFPWEKGDILMLDNMLVAHARSPFKGARKVVVAMAEEYGL